MVYLMQKKILILASYILLILVGIANLTHMYPDFFSAFSPFFISGTALLILTEVFSFFEKVDHYNKKTNRVHLKKMIFFVIGLFLFSFILELVGMQTQILFGQFSYGNGLGFKIAGVPPVVACIRISFFFCSLAIAEMNKLWDFQAFSNIKKAFATAFFMLILDFFLEPAAQVVDYWQWNYGFAPIQNYLTWFIAGFLISFIYFKAGFRRNAMPGTIKHLYFAQVIFFIITAMKEII